MHRLTKMIILTILMVLILDATSGNEPAEQHSASWSSESNEHNNGVEKPPVQTGDQNNWCRFPNGSTIALGYSYMHTPCTTCRCTETHMIRCATLNCMPTYCVDDSKPALREGQCCGQCSYERDPASCVYSNVKFPHGSVVKTTNDKATCWCQYGNIECRKAASSIFSSMDIWGDGTAIYVVIIIVCAMLILGTLVCCGCVGFFYCYYKRNQSSLSQVYEQYWNNAGWQPMSDGEQAYDGTNQEKQVESEQGQMQNDYPIVNLQDYIPPPYAAYNPSHMYEEGVKGQK